MTIIKNRRDTTYKSSSIALVGATRRVAPTIRRMIILWVIFLLAGCAGDAGGTQGGGDGAGQAVERYLQAKVEGDAETLRGLLCSAMEADLNREANAFASVTGVEIEDMVCTMDEGQSSVTCTGQIVADYGGEATTFPLTRYQVVQEDGEWKWCGEAG